MNGVDVVYIHFFHLKIEFYRPYHMQPTMQSFNCKMLPAQEVLHNNVMQPNIQSSAMFSLSTGAYKVVHADKFDDFLDHTQFFVMQPNIHSSAMFYRLL